MQSERQFIRLQNSLSLPCSNVHHSNDHAKKILCCLVYIQSEVLMVSSLIIADIVIYQNEYENSMFTKY